MQALYEVTWYKHLPSWPSMHSLCRGHGTLEEAAWVDSESLIVTGSFGEALDA